MQDLHMTTTEQPTVTYRKQESGFTSRTRYDVFVGDIRVGWVSRWIDETEWTFYATVRETHKGESLGTGKTRRDAVCDGLGTLRIWHGGGIRRFDLDTLEEVLVVVPSDTLRAAENRLLDEKYGTA